jgi:hypothetical protein
MDAKGRLAKTELLDLASLPRDRLERMCAAGEEVLAIHRRLEAGGENVVGEVLRGEGTFYELDHYPKGDVYDRSSHAQYFYHAHPGAMRDSEHGHFHTFLRAAGMPEGIVPARLKRSEPWPEGEEAISHIIAISMDGAGQPIRLFSTNRWVTGETWYRQADVCRMIDRFALNDTEPARPTDRWLGAMLRLFWPQIITLLKARDNTLAAWQKQLSGRDALEDRRLEITAQSAISVEAQLRAARAALA